MAYFPISIDMERAKVLVVGGGKIAAQKLERLINFTEDVAIVSPEICEEVDRIIKNNSLILYKRAYTVGDISGYDIVVVATDNIELQRDIYEESRGSRILVNSVDSTDYCDFIFPSYIKRDDLIVTFSTSGASPSFAKYIRRYFENIIPDNVGEFLQKMKHLRDKLPKGKERMSYFDHLVSDYFNKHFKS